MSKKKCPQQRDGLPRTTVDCKGGKVPERARLPREASLRRCESQQWWSYMFAEYYFPEEEGSRAANGALTDGVEESNE